MKKLFHFFTTLFFIYAGHLLATPIVGSEFLAWQDAQKTQIQKELEVIFQEENGFTVTGPLAPLMHHNSNIDEAFHALRVICHHSNDLYEAITIIENIPHLSLRQYFLQPEYEGVLATYHTQGQQIPVLFCTLQQTRYMIWYKGQVKNPEVDTQSPEFHAYAKAILEYFDNLEDQMPFDPPKASDYDLPISCDLFPLEKPTVISDEEYDNLLNKHREINWGSIKGVKGFIPSEELISHFIHHAPQYGLQDVNNHLFQRHLQTLYESQGRDLIGKPLTLESVINTDEGEYLFAVAISGKARFAKVSIDPEHNSHAVLLLGEPTLCAGVMKIGSKEGLLYVASANIFSKQYLFSPYAENIYEVISEYSDSHLATIGHFLKVLREENIPHENIIIEKY